MTTTMTNEASWTNAKRDARGAWPAQKSRMALNSREARFPAMFPAAAGAADHKFYPNRFEILPQALKILPQGTENGN